MILSLHLQNLKNGAEISLGLSCLCFIQLLDHVFISFYKYEKFSAIISLKKFFCTTVFLLFFSDPDDTTISSAGIVLQVPEILFIFPIFFLSDVQIGKFLFFCLHWLVSLPSLFCYTPIQGVFKIFGYFYFSVLRFPFCSLYVLFICLNFLSFYLFLDGLLYLLKHFYSSCFKDFVR